MTVVQANEIAKQAIRAAAPSLVTIPDVEIVSTGTYDLASPGNYTFTAQDLADAVAAQDDPAVQSPRLKIGHMSEFGDGEPSFGKVVNMRLVNAGQTIKGDLVGVPKWLADILPTAYPNRSLEGTPGATTSTGRKYNLVITAVSLLGVTAPGVSVLKDLPALYGDEEPEGLLVEAAEPICAAVGQVQAAVEVEDVRRAYYDSLSTEQVFWWVRSVELDPNALIVDDDDGHLYRVPFYLSGESVTFDDPEEVRIQYQPVAASGPRIAAAFSTRSESRPENNEEEDQVKLTEEQLKKLGLPADATPEQIDAKVEELTAETPESPAEEPAQPGEEPSSPETPAEEPQPSEQPAEEPVTASGTTTIDDETLRQLQAGAEAGRKAEERQRVADRDSFIQAAVKDGKIPPSRVQHWASQYDADPQGTKETIESFPANLIPINAQGSAPGEQDTQVQAYDEEWLSPAERSRIAAAKSGQSSIVTQETPPTKETV